MEAGFGDKEGGVGWGGCVGGDPLVISELKMPFLILLKQSACLTA